jgi:hypothetical protein
MTIRIRKLEEQLARMLAPILRRLDQLERDAAIERRLAVIEQRAGVSQIPRAARDIEHREFNELEWLDHVGRLTQRRDFGQWRPEHASWRNVGGRC